ncbi:MAG: hypothetical protein PHD40_05480 [Syntrophomonadaceae bacterium]|nr:hypothetical protein [Syntrophomonadaceae bacterium]
MTNIKELVTVDLPVDVSGNISYPAQEKIVAQIDEIIKLQKSINALCQRIDSAPIDINS